MQYVVGNGLIKGKSATTLNPLDNVTRAEIAAILQRFIEGNKYKITLRSESYGSLLLYIPLSKYDTL